MTVIRMREPQFENRREGKRTPLDYHFERQVQPMFHDPQDRDCFWGLRVLFSPTVQTEAFMRTAVVFLALLLSACGGAYHTSSDGGLDSRIRKEYEARDACLMRNAAAEGVGNVDAATVAQAAALACTEETAKLVEVSNRDGDPKVAAAIRNDTEFRAMGYVLKARGQVSN